jgi:pyridoxine/pyridoxamine 5'-phosphate oxidase
MSNEVFEQYGTDPVALCKDWLAEAVKHEINDPEAINIATADAQGRPSNRMILIKEITERGFKFHTNEDGQKGREIAENPHASMCFYWKSIRKQIRITGTVAQVSDAESDEYFTTRPIQRLRQPRRNGSQRQKIRRRIRRRQQHPPPTLLERLSLATGNNGILDGTQSPPAHALYLYKNR